ncbi:hypothetical protein [Nonomuraea sp. NPDC050643]|uniref:alpha/beta fold hydrolase n=1 Tax=Nonomuraea sp. NPDC050643 TaxID=3155660 RepID=UPI0033F6810E
MFDDFATELVDVGETTLFVRHGGSGKPPTTPGHEPYSKRAMARDLVALMRHLGHDRGSYVAHRLAADHPGAVTPRG